MSIVTEGAVAGPGERRSPGLAALFDALESDGRHSILDLGPAAGRRLRILGRFATQVRFVDLLARAGPGTAWDEGLGALRPNPARPYDVVLAWDVLDRLGAEERLALVARLAAVTAPRARLYALAAREGTGSAAGEFVLVDRDRIAERPADGEAAAHRPILPAELERALAPFDVVNAYMLRTGAREYVAMKRE